MMEKGNNATESTSAIGGNPSELWKELVEFTRSAQFLSESTPRLLDQYHQKWIAVFNGKVASAADSFQAIIELVDAKHIPRDKVIVRYIDKEPKTMIL